jgi:hypothetical protein
MAAQLIMNKKLFSHLIIFLFSALIFQGSAYSNTTKWEDARLSLSQLLDSGWQITGHGTNRVAANSSSGNSFDVKTYSFLLTKSGKYIICLLENPGQPATDDKCRKLN